MSVPNVVVGYSPNDFFYTQAIASGVMPSPDQCAALDVYNTNWDASCATVDDMADDASGSCINRELCINQEQAEYIRGVQNQNNGADEKYTNSKTLFESTLLTTINLGVGIVLLIVLIYKNKAAV